MKNQNNQSQRDGAGVLKEHDVNRLIVEPITNQIREQGVWSLEQSNEILGKLEKLDELIEIIARQMYRASEGEGQ